MTKANAPEAGKVIDVVCGMTIERGSAAGTSQYGGESYYFCSSSCKSQFDAEPGRYAHKPASNG